ncbi:hypothetical protein J7J00_23450 [Bacillus sp. ISL-4]|nr:hypothetical protein [Bacillus sp. ISL-4]
MSTGTIKAMMRNGRPVIITIGRLAQNYFPESASRVQVLTCTENALLLANAVLSENNKVIHL